MEKITEQVEETPIEKLIKWYEDKYPLVDFDNPAILHKMQDLAYEEKQKLSTPSIKGSEITLSQDDFKASMIGFIEWANKEHTYVGEGVWDGPDDSTCSTEMLLAEFTGPNISTPKAKVEGQTLDYGYLCKLDGDKVFVIAENIAAAFDLLATKGEKYEMIQHSSIDILQESNLSTPQKVEGVGEAAEADLVTFGNYLLKKHNVQSDGVTNEDLFNWNHPLVKND